MKISNPAFLEAKKSKNITFFSVIKRKDFKENLAVWVAFMRLTISQKQQYTDKEETIRVDCDIEFSTNNYSFNPRRVIHEICFSQFVNDGSDHIRTFLASLNKDSDLHFRIVAFSNNDVLNGKDLVCHDLYGIVNHKTFFLDRFVGLDNFMSPIKWKIEEPKS